MARAGSRAQLPHTDVATHPEGLPPDSKDISRCHLSSFLCLSENYQVAVQGRRGRRAGTPFNCRGGACC